MTDEKNTLYNTTQPKEQDTPTVSNARRKAGIDVAYVVRGSTRHIKLTERESKEKK